MPREVLGGLFIAASSLQFGFVVLFGKLLARRDVPVPTMLAVRFGVAGAVLMLVHVVTREGMRAARGERGVLILLGAAAYAVEAALFFLAVHRGTASAVTLLFFVYPVLVTLLAAALGSGIPAPMVLASLAAAIAGAALVIASSGGLDITTAGVIFAIGSAAMYTLYLTGAERAARRTPPMTAAMWVSFSASGALALYAIASNAGRWPRGIHEWPQVIAMGVFTAGAFLCLFNGLRILGAVRTAIIAAMEPLAASTLAIVFLDEPLRLGMVAGGALILGGAITASIARGARGTTDNPIP